MAYIIKRKIKIPYFNNEERTLRICLPEGYDESNDKYPVIYFHDGQNVFYGKSSASGDSWNVLETLENIDEEYGKKL